MEVIRKELERIEKETLSKYATLSMNSLGRDKKEKENAGCKAVVV